MSCTRSHTHYTKTQPTYSKVRVYPFLKQLDHQHLSSSYTFHFSPSTSLCTKIIITFFHPCLFPSMPSIIPFLGQLFFPPTPFLFNTFHLQQHHCATHYLSSSSSTYFLYNTILLQCLSFSTSLCTNTIYHCLPSSLPFSFNTLPLQHFSSSNTFHLQQHHAPIPSIIAFLSNIFPLQHPYSSTLSLFNTLPPSTSLCTNSFHHYIRYLIHHLSSTLPTTINIFTLHHHFANLCMLQLVHTSSTLKPSITNSLPLRYVLYFLPFHSQLPCHSH